MSDLYRINLLLHENQEADRPSHVQYKAVPSQNLAFM